MLTTLAVCSSCKCDYDDNIYVSCPFCALKHLHRKRDDKMIICKDCDFLYNPEATPTCPVCMPAYVPVDYRCSIKELDLVLNIKKRDAILNALSAAHSASREYILKTELKHVTLEEMLEESSDAGSRAFSDSLDLAGFSINDGDLFTEAYFRQE